MDVNSPRIYSGKLRKSLVKIESVGFDVKTRSISHKP